MRFRTRYVALEDVVAGMTLGAPVSLACSGLLRVSLPADHVLTDDNLRQLSVYGCEFVTVVEEDHRSDEQVAEDAALAARRTLEIFSGADLGKPFMARLFDQVLSHRSA